MAACVASGWKEVKIHEDTHPENSQSCLCLSEPACRKREPHVGVPARHGGAGSIGGELSALWRGKSPRFSGPLRKQ